MRTHNYWDLDTSVNPLLRDGFVNMKYEQQVND